MNFIAWLHHFLLQIEEHLGEAWLFLREREHCLVDNLQAERCADALAACIDNVEVDARVGTGLIDGGIGSGLDLQPIRGLDKEKAMVGDWFGVTAKEISVDVEGPRHLRRGVQC